MSYTHYLGIPEANKYNTQAADSHAYHDVNTSKYVDNIEAALSQAYATQECMTHHERVRNSTSFFAVASAGRFCCDIVVPHCLCRKQHQAMC